MSRPHSQAMVSQGLTPLHPQPTVTVQVEQEADGRMDRKRPAPGEVHGQGSEAVARPPEGPQCLLCGPVIPTGD